MFNLFQLLQFWMFCLISYAKNVGVLTLHAYWNFAWEILNDASSL